MQYILSTKKKDSLATYLTVLYVVVGPVKPSNLLQGDSNQFLWQSRLMNWQEKEILLWQLSGNWDLPSGSLAGWDTLEAGCVMVKEPHVAQWQHTQFEQLRLLWTGREIL